MLKKWTKRLLKLFGWLTIGGIALVVVLLIALNTGPGQRFLTKKVNKQLASMLQTDVSIGGIGIAIPQMLSLKNVYLNTPSGDSLARIGYLGVNMNMWALLKQQIVIESINVADVFGNVVVTDTSSNIQFLLDAFVPQDTVVQIETTLPDSTASNWLVDLNNTRLKLSAIDVYYQDDLGGMTLDVLLKEGQLLTDTFNLSKQQYFVKNLSLNEANVQVNLSTANDTTSSVSSSLLAGCKELSLEKVFFSLQMDELKVATSLPSFSATGFRTNVSETLQASLQNLALKDAAFNYDISTAPLLDVGVDFNHIAVTETQLNLNDFTYQGDSIRLAIDEFSTKEQSGLALKNLSANFAFHPAFIALNDLVLATPNTELTSAELYYAIPKANEDPLKELNLDAQGRIGITDLLLLSPDLSNTALLAKNRTAAITFNTQLNTDNNQLLIDQLEVSAPGLVLRSRGKVANVLEVKKLSGNLFLEQLSFYPEDFIPLFSKGTIPDYIQWPKQVVAFGNIAYQNQQLALQLSAREDRIQQNQWTRFSVNGKASRPFDFPNSRLDMQLDSLLLTKSSVLAYLPPQTLPQGYQLPSFIRANGQIIGPIDDLDMALFFTLPGNRTFAKLNGNIKEAMNPGQLYMDVAIQEFSINKEDVQAILPDSLLPANINLPSFVISEAKLKGALDDLTFDLPIQTTNGNWLLVGQYNPEDLQISAEIKGIQAEDFFIGDIRDTLLVLGLQPLNITAAINGQISPQLYANFTANITEQSRGQLLYLEGLVDDNVYETSFAFDHPYFVGNGDANYAVKDSTASVDGSVQLEKLDLAHWGLSDRPLVASGAISLKSNGLNPNDMEAAVLIDDIFLRGDGSAAFVDSLKLDARLNQGDNLITISGDVIEGELSGKFDPVAIVPELSNFLSSYLREEPFSKEAVVNGSHLLLNLHIKNPLPFTTGLIPGLHQLSPITINMTYRDEAPEFKFALNAAQITYTNLSLTEMKIEALGTEKELTFSTDWQNVSYGEDLQLGHTQIKGKSGKNGLAVDLNVFAHDSIRHNLGLQLMERDSQQILVLNENQILNFETWTIPESNAVFFSDEVINVRNWKLSQANSSIQIDNTDTEGLAIEFNQINLNNLSRIINTEAELLAGELNGTVYLDHLLTNFGLRTDLQIQDLAYYQQAMGDLEAIVSSKNNKTFDLDVALQGAGNKVVAKGQYLADGLLDINLQLEKLQISTLEPFSLGYLQKTEGFIQGNCAIGGSVTEPTLEGQIDFKEVALAINLLGSRYRIDEQRIQFDTKRIRFDNFTFLDDNNNSATLDGLVLMESINDIRFDLAARTRDFLAIDSEAKDNDLFYGYLRVNADVVITGDLNEPHLLITATPTGNSEITYAYTDANQASIQTTQGVVTFAETYEWEEIIKTGERDTVINRSQGAYIETNLSINDKLLVHVIVDPLTQQEFSGRGTGDITFIQYPTGQQQLTGQIEMSSGKYDMVLEGLQRYVFDLEPESKVFFTGNPTNPQLDLTISNTIKTSPLPLVQAFDPTANTADLRKRQTFKVMLGLKGDMQGMDIEADIRYPDDIYGNTGLSSVDNALSSLRQNQSQVYVTAITLMTFKNFILSGASGTNDTQQEVANGVAGAVGDALSTLVNNQLGFVDVDLGVENYQTSTGEQNYNLRLSLQKSFLNDRLVISVDGVTNTAQDTENSEAQTYLDNVSVAYLLDKDGSLRIKLFNDRDRNVFVGGNVMRFGGRLVFSKDFDHFFWEKN